MFTGWLAPYTTFSTVRCPICHRQAPLRLDGGKTTIAPHTSGSQQCSGTGSSPDERVRTAKEIAAVVVREMRRQADERISERIGDHPDREAVLNPTAEQVRARLEIHIFTLVDRCAFMVLGDEAAIAEYMRKPVGPETITDTERAKLIRAAERG